MIPKYMRTRAKASGSQRAPKFSIPLISQDPASSDPRLKSVSARQCAFIRGSALIGSKCVIGNSTELKNVIISDNVQVPHYNYVGDSILGYKSHLGAGAITSNVKSDKTLVCVKNGDEVIETGLKKFAAIVGDNVEVGCQSVLNPGTVIGRGCRVYPLSRVRGVIPEKHIFKDKDEIVPIED